jgi:hypothetical protein
LPDRYCWCRPPPPPPSTRIIVAQWPGDFDRTVLTNRLAPRQPTLSHSMSINDDGVAPLMRLRKEEFNDAIVLFVVQSLHVVVVLLIIQSRPITN